MTVMPLDTHAYFKKLVATGLSETQAEAIASGLISGLTENLATKEELFATKEELRGEIALVRGEVAELRGDMNAMESRLRGEMGELRGDMAELRGDMNAMESRLRGEMGDLRGEMGAMEARLLRWGAVGLLSIIAVNLAMTGMMFTILNP
jgi:chromosome segregation ATPase